jgi:molybdate transport system substrate-binding protein
MQRLTHLLLLFVASLSVVGCTQITGSTQGEAPASSARTATTTLNVFAAASLTDAFGEIGANFAAAHPGTEVVFNFGGSNQLSTQIGQGAPADVFASANNAQMDAAIEAGRIISGSQSTFAQNRLVIVLPSDNPGGLTSLQNLAKPRIKLVFAAEEVPVGQYALDFLDKAAADGSLGADYRDAVLANVVSYEENVRSVLAKVALGEADAGLVYTSDASTSEGEVQQIEIPDSLNSIAKYPIAVLSDSAHLELAQQFVDYVLAPEGQQVLAKYGFLPVTR